MIRETGKVAILHPALLRFPEIPVLIFPRHSLRPDEMDRLPPPTPGVSLARVCKKHPKYPLTFLGLPIMVAHANLPKARNLTSGRLTSADPISGSGRR